MLHRTISKIKRVLINAVLEWTLIFLLLLNSLFSYLIISFAKYFGLNPPCLWCSRVDHFFEPGKNKNFHRDLLCKAHVAEVSKLGFCSNHKKLAESHGMCKDCFSSRPEFHDLKKNDGNDKVGLTCSCCGESLDCSKYSEHMLIRPASLDDLEFFDRKHLMREVKDDDHLEEGRKFDVGRTDFATDQSEKHCLSEKSNEKLVASEVDDGFVVRGTEKPEEGFLPESVSEPKEKETKEERESVVKKIEGIIMKDQSVQVSFGDHVSSGTLTQHLEFFLDGSGHWLVPVELIDSPIKKDQGTCRSIDKNQEYGDIEGAHLNFEMNVMVEDKIGAEMEPEAAFSMQKYEEESKFSVFESMEMEEDENSFAFHAREFPSAMTATEQEEKQSELEGVPKVPVNETDAEVSIGTEIPDVDATDDIHPHDIIFHCESSQENPPTSGSNLPLDDNHSAKPAEEQTVELRSWSAETTEHIGMNQTLFGPALNSTEEENVLDTPTSVDTTTNLIKKSFFLEKGLGTEDSLEGSLTSELECVDGVETVESLKYTLKAGRKTLQALYAELEEERSASAVAANQTMAMINRLQEEKAQMQMEALQYQRMMEEQSEYDQEALQLLNELMVKREKEKQEIEKEFEVYRRKVVEYETKERLRMLRKSKDGINTSGFSSASCSNEEDSDVLSIDLNQEVKDEDGFYGHEENCNVHSPVDAVLSLEESLTDFEEARLSILEQLKILEVKLMNLDEEEKHISEENRNHNHENGHPNGDANGHVNGYSKEINVTHHQERRTIGAKGKSLLPLFDAIDDDENGGAELDAITNGFDSNGIHDSDMRNLNLDLENEKLNVEEQVDHLYERLQALEADREFLKHCMSSLRKGDKGVHLLQEILQHLRDLRNVELRARNFDHDVLLFKI